MKNVLPILLTGVPASGKSSVMKSIISQLQKTPEEFKFGKLTGTKRGNVYILGKYEGGAFDGTDRLPMDVIGDAIAFIKQLESNTERCVVLLEGDRLSNERFIVETGSRVLAIDAREDILLERHILRNDKQSATFLKRTRTKFNNIVKRFNLRVYYNNTPSDSKVLSEYLVSIINKWNNNGLL